MSEQTNYINLDTILGEKKETAKDQVIVIQEAITPVAPTRIVDWDSILSEVSYKLPKGYPTVVDGVFTEREEIIIINEALEAEGLPTLPLPEVTHNNNILSLAEGSTTNEKETTVCVIANLCGKYGSNMVKALKSTSDTKAKDVLKAAGVATVAELLNALVNDKYNRYDKDKKSLAKCLTLLGLNPKLESPDKKVEGDSTESGLAIYKRYKTVYLIRDADFHVVKKRGPELWSIEFSGEQLFEDNWCPADIFISKTDPSAIATKAKAATSLNTYVGSSKPLNAYFSNPQDTNFTDFIGISLKQGDAQAGKGSKFIKNVTLGKIKETTSTVDKGTKNALSSYKGFTRYLRKPDKSDEMMGALKIYEKGWSVFGISKNSIQGKEKYAELNINQVIEKLQQIGTVEDYHNLRTKPKSVLAFVEAVDRKAAEVADNFGTVEETTQKFITSRNKFIKALQESNVKVSAVTNSKDLVVAMQKHWDKSKFGIYLVQKIATYDFFVDVFNNWTAATIELKSYFKKISKVSNPFVATALFCMAEAGISPMFTKLKVDHFDDFTHDYTINTKKSAQDVKVNDTAKAAGFDVFFNIQFGSKSYAVKLSFRFANSAIRAEVSQLDLL